MSMEIIEKLSALLSKKKELFTQYEELTDKLSVCSLEHTRDIEEYITNRARLANQIDKISAEIAGLCAGAENGERLLAAIGNRCNYSDVPVEARGLFTSAQEIFGCINRIAGQEPQIVQRMRGESENMLAKIKGAQNTPKIARYLNGLTTKAATGTYLGQQYDKA